MDHSIVIAGIAQTPAMLGVLYNIYVTMGAKREAREAKLQGEKNEVIGKSHTEDLRNQGDTLKQLEVNTNHKFDELLDSTKREKLLEGAAAQRKETDASVSAGEASEARIAKAVFDMIQAQQGGKR